jgi:hypothetical protein
MPILIGLSLAWAWTRLCFHGPKKAAAPPAAAAEPRSRLREILIPDMDILPEYARLGT